jgi:hypothetical protein
VCELAEEEAKYRVENWEDYGYDTRPSKDTLFNDIMEDSGFFEDIWDSEMEYLTEEMKRRNPSGYWTASVRGFGWRNLDGEMDTFYATKGVDLLGKILPNTDCTFYIHEYGKTGFAIHNYHHDSPTGEWYYIEKAKEEEE